MGAERSRYRAGGKFDQAIAELIEQRGGGDNSYLIQEMITTALKLIDERPDRGELKIINTALKELRYAFKIFTPYRHLRKVSVFGSARAPKKSPEFHLAKEFAKKIVRKGYMVITGAASGIMEAANEGAGSQQSFGINIRLPFEQEPNPFIREDEKLMTFKYFFTRKLIFIKESSAIVLFPGGYGTHDECFEALTLIQTGKSNPLPLVMVEHPTRPYWRQWSRFVKHQLLDPKYISPEDLRLFKITPSVDEAVEEIERFYRNYHSSRFVNDLFVIRLQRVTPALLERLNTGFKDLLEPKGKFERVDPYPEETGEKEALHLARIAFPFNRTSYGRIREMIDAINEY
jgi:uncharacterized protein (TIGR00730 family)